MFLLELSISHLEIHMSHIAVRHILTERTTYAGEKWFFEFDQLKRKFPEHNSTQYIKKLLAHVKQDTSSWCSKLNSEWLTRHYMAVKMIFSASLMLTSAEFSSGINIRITEHYLQYYAIFSCLRAVQFTDPRMPFNNGKIFKETHSKTINVATNAIRSMCNETGEKIFQYAKQLKDMREILSYGAPSSGPSLYESYESEFGISLDETVSICQLLSEVAQLHSEILEISLRKNHQGTFELDDANYSPCFEYNIHGRRILDREDWYRLDYLSRKCPRPTNLLLMVSEGHVEDFFGAWRLDTDDPDCYNPDDDWRIIFPFP